MMRPPTGPGRSWDRSRTTGYASLRMRQILNLPSSVVLHRLHSASKREGTEESVKIQDLARVITRNAEAMFGKEFLSESESALLAQFSFGYRDRSSAAQFVELFDRLVAEYL